MTFRALSGWVGDADAFFAGCWRTAPAVFRPGTSLSAPIALADVDDVISGGLLRVPYLEMVDRTSPAPEGKYTTSRTIHGAMTRGFADAAGIRRLLDAGSTLLLRNVEQWHAPTRNLTQAMADDFGRAVEAFLFVTPPGAQGLAVHRDDADVLLLQINGSKHWTVYGGPTNSTWAPGAASDVGPALLDRTIQEGEVLYVPRGFAHEATSERGLSVHLSLTVREVSAQELYVTLQRLLLDGLTLPPRPLSDDALLDSAEQVLDRFRTKLATITAHDILDSARATRQASETSAPTLAALASPEMPPTTSASSQAASSRFTRR